MAANSSFVHQSADARLTEAEILADPVAKIAAVGGARHPSIPLPEDLFAPGHRNSRLDLSEFATLDATVRRYRRRWRTARGRPRSAATR